MEGDPRPQVIINDNVLNNRRTNRFSMPGNAGRKKGNTLKSAKRNSHFRNAKPASMAEEGLKLVESHRLGSGTKGILEESDGIRIKVEVVRDIHIGPSYKEEYTFRDDNGKIYTKEYDDGGWSFYTFIEPVPFVPKKRVQRKTHKQRKQRKAKGNVMRN
jgi:hypothetical protein